MSVSPLLASRQGQGMVRGGTNKGGKWYDAAAAAGGEREREIAVMTMMTWSAKGQGLGPGHELGDGLVAGLGDESSKLPSMAAMTQLRAVVEGLSMRRQWTEEAWALDKYTTTTTAGTATGTGTAAATGTSANAGDTCHPPPLPSPSLHLYHYYLLHHH